MIVQQVREDTRQHYKDTILEMLSRQRHGSRTWGRHAISTLLELFLYHTFPNENHYHYVAQTLIAYLDATPIYE